MAGGSGTHPISGSDMALWGQNRQPGQGEEEFVSWGSWIYPPGALLPEVLGSSGQPTPPALRLTPLKL